MFKHILSFTSSVKTLQNLPTWKWYISKSTCDHRL